MTTNHTHDGSANPQGLPQPPMLEIDDYRADLAGFDLSPEQASEVLQYLWNIVKMVVDAGYGLDGASLVLSAISREVFGAHSISDNDATQSERKDP